VGCPGTAWTLVEVGSEERRREEAKKRRSEEEALRTMLAEDWRLEANSTGGDGDGTVVMVAASDGHGMGCSASFLFAVPVPAHLRGRAVYGAVQTCKGA
jgi:hypothetical protein